MELREIIKQLKNNAEKIHEKQVWIEEKEEALRKEIKPVQEEAYVLGVRNAELEKTPVRVRALDLRKALAEEWECDEADLRMWCESWTGTAKASENLRREILKRLEGRNLNIHFANKSGRKNCTIATKIDGDAIQADGKTLRQHLIIKTSEKTINDICFVQVGLDNVETLVIELPLNQLARVYWTGEIQPKNSVYCRPMLKLALQEGENKDEKEKTE